MKKISPVLSDREERDLINGKIGDKEMPDVLVFAKRFVDNHIEFVFLIRDDEFKANQDELEALNEFEAGSWKTPEAENEYNYQLAVIREFRINELKRIAIDY
ncbi:MAG: hypothetical protein AAF600_08500 [Bacteroidota bacterium]